jgi:lysophospholipase L1-like esterase
MGERRVRRRAKELVPMLALSALALAACLLLLEGVVRLLLPQQLLFYRPDLYRQDERIGWRFAPGLDTRVNTGERDVRLLTDARGLRIGGVESEEAGLRVLAVGDSFVAGLQVEHADLMTTRLAEGLTRKLGRRVEPVASGVPGWGPAQYALEVEHELARSRYDAVLVFLFLGNDVVADRSFAPDEFRRGFDRPFRRPRAFTAAELKAALLVPLDDFLEVRSHLYVLVDKRLENLRIRLGMSPFFIPRTLLREMADAPAWDLTAEICAELAASAEAVSVPTLFLLLPSDYQVDRERFERHLTLLRVEPDSVDLDQPSRLLRAALARRGLDVADATPALVAAYERGARDLFGSIDAHFSPAGHRVVADWLEPLVREQLVTRGR